MQPTKPFKHPTEMKRKIIYSSEEDEPTEQTKITLSEVIEIEDDNDNEMDYDERSMIHLSIIKLT